jgi:hypothetical protein
MSFHRFRRRRRWTLAVADAPGRPYDIVRLPFDVEPPAAAQKVMYEAAPPLLELALRARRVQSELHLVGEAAGGLLVADLRAVLRVSADAGWVLRSALDAHGRDVGYSTRPWHRRAAQLTDALREDQLGTFPAEVATVAGLRLTLALHAARHDPMAVPGHLAAATGRVDAVRALASALLPDRQSE